MLNINGRVDRFCGALSRRRFLQIGGLAPLGELTHFIERRDIAADELEPVVAAELRDPRRDDAQHARVPVVAAEHEGVDTVTVEVTTPAGQTWSFLTNHTFSEDQVEWLARWIGIDPDRFGGSGG